MTILDQLQELQERAHRQDLESAQAKIEKAEKDARLAEDVMARAIAEANGDDCASALRHRDQSLDDIRKFTHELNALEEEKPAKPSPLSQLKVIDFGAMHIEPKRSFADCVSPNDLLDKHGVASYLAHKWLSANCWFANASAVQRTIVETLHGTLRAQNLCVSQPEYWTSLTGLVGHLKLDSFTIPKEAAPLNVQEKILAIMESLANAIISPEKTPSEAPAVKSAPQPAATAAPAVKKPARVRKKPKTAATVV